jgi:S1-C subfamily serine protease
MARSSTNSLLCGMLGGGLVVAACAAIVVVGGFGSSTKTVTRIVQVPVERGIASGQAPGPTVHDVYERDAPGVVYVSASGVSEAQSPSEFLKGESAPRGPASGSGFQIDGNGTILTNWHVVANASKITVSLDEKGKTVNATVVGRDPSRDLAFLRIPTAGLTLHPIAMGDSNAVQVGEPVMTIGNPFGYTRTLTTGVISALERHIQAPNGTTIPDILQTDTPVNPGNSGGPLLNQQGQAIGITSQIVTAGNRSGNIGIAFAIPIDAVKAELAAHGGFQAP